MSGRSEWVPSKGTFERTTRGLVLTVAQRRAWWVATARAWHELAPLFVDEFDSADEAMRAADNAAHRFATRRETSMG